MPNRSASIVCVSLACVASTMASAATITAYTSQPAWEAALPAGQVFPFVTETLDSAPIGDFIELDLGTLRIDATSANDADIGTGTTFGNINGTPFLVGFVSQDDPVTNTKRGTISVIFDDPQLAFGATIRDGATGARVAMEALGTRVGTITTNATQFLGFISDTPFTRIDFVRSGDNTTFGEIFYTDNFVSAAVIPEPATLTALAGAGLLALRRRRA